MPFSNLRGIFLPNFWYNLKTNHTKGWWNQTAGLHFVEIIVPFPRQRSWCQGDFDSLIRDRCLFFYACQLTRFLEYSFNRQEIEKISLKKFGILGCPQVDFFRAKSIWCPWLVGSLHMQSPTSVVQQPSPVISPNNTTSLWSSMANLTVCLQHKELPPLSIFVYLWNLLNVGKHLCRGHERIYPFWWDQTTSKSMVILRDFPYSAWLVSYHDPLSIYRKRWTLRVWKFGNDGLPMHIPGCPGMDL